MDDDRNPPSDEGGEAPCFAHLFDQPAELAGATPARLVAEPADTVLVADDGTIVDSDQAAT